MYTTPDIGSKAGTRSSCLRYNRLLVGQLPGQERNSKYTILVTFNIYNVIKENYKYKKDTNQSLENKIITYNYGISACRPAHSAVQKLKLLDSFFDFNFDGLSKK